MASQQKKPVQQQTPAKRPPAQVPQQQTRATQPPQRTTAPAQKRAAPAPREPEDDDTEISPPTRQQVAKKKTAAPPPEPEYEEAADDEVAADDDQSTDDMVDPESATDDDQAVEGDDGSGGDDTFDPEAGDDGSGDGMTQEGDDSSGDLEMELDMEDMDEDDIKGLQIPDGYYHVEVDEVTRGTSSKKKTDYIGFRFRILNGAQISGEPINKFIGKIQVHELYVTDKTKDTQARFAIYLGAVPKAALGQKARVNWASAVGKQAVIQIRAEAQENGTPRARVTMRGVFRIDDPDLPVPIPYDEEALAAAGIKRKPVQQQQRPGQQRPGARRV